MNDWVTVIFLIGFVVTIVFYLNTFNQANEKQIERKRKSNKRQTNKTRIKELLKKGKTEEGLTQEEFKELNNL